MTNPFEQLTAEEKLLISLCRMRFSDVQKSEIKYLMDEVADWDHFVKLANDHGIIALIWNNLYSTGNADKIPVKNLARLRNGYLASLSRNTFLFKNLAKILDIIKNEKIKIVLLKGSALEKTVYGDKGLRQMNDIDLLVPKNRAIALRKILITNGFTSLPVKSALYNLILLDIGKHLPSLIKDECSVDIHHELFGNDYGSMTEQIIEKSIPVRVEHYDVSIPSPQLFFLYLIAHINSHENTGESQLRLYADLVVLLESYYGEIIDKDLINSASKAHLINTLADKLTILKIFWQLNYPEWLSELISRYNDPLKTIKFPEFIRQPKENPVEDEALNYILQIKTIPGILKKCIFITGFLFPSTGFMKQRYDLKNKIFAFLYYPLRWARTAAYMLRARGRELSHY